MSAEQDIRVGDIVCAKRKDTDGNDVEIHGTVRIMNREATGVITVGNQHLIASGWSIEVTKRPYVFPTEPGLYIRKGVSTLNENYGVYRLTEGGEWLILNAYNNTPEPAAVKRNMELYGTELVRLVVGSVES